MWRHDLRGEVTALAHVGARRQEPDRPTDGARGGGARGGTRAAGVGGGPAPRGGAPPPWRAGGGAAVGGQPPPQECQVLLVGLGDRRTFAAFGDEGLPHARLVAGEAEREL